MRNRFILFITLVLTFFLQCTLCRKIAVGSIAPNLLIIFVISIGLMRGRKTALLTGFFTGLLADLIYGQYLGIYAFLYMLVGYLSGYSYKIYYDNNIKVPMVLAAGGDFLYNIGVFLLMFLLQGKMQGLYYLRRIIIPEMIYTVFLTAIVYRVYYLINHRLMEAERKERDALWLLK